MRALRLLFGIVSGALALLALTGQASAQLRCPTQSFLEYAHLVYASHTIPPSVSLAPGKALGEGLVDELTDATGCKRKRSNVQVVRLGGIDPRVAVAVEGRARTAFVLGARCAGYEDAELAGCLTRPLAFDSQEYVGTRYPATQAPRRTLPAGARLGAAKLGEATVQAVRIDGVDPAVAVAVEGRPFEAFLAVPACPYERFDNRPAYDDLLRCLRAPVWFSFDPLGARPGDRIVARADRPVAPELVGAPVSLVRLRVATDAVPRDTSGSIRLGSVAAAVAEAPALAFTVPELDQGVYEVLVTCEPCAQTHAGQTVFPAGSVLVLGKRGGSGPRIVVVVIGGVFMALIVGAVVAWRRGWHRRRPAPGA